MRNLWDLRVAGMILALTAGLALTACDRGSANAPARDHAGDDGDRSRSGGAASGGYGGDRSSYSRRDERPRAPVPLVEGKPMWSDNRLHTADENATYQFGKWGADLGAKDVKDYVKKAHAFIDHPAADVQTVTRANGDTLMYDPAKNIFVVARKDGAPRTMFKPHDGGAYWKEQQAKAASGDTGYSRRRSYNAPSAKEFQKSGDDN